jgi:signal transduction histidine kinase/CheY-like chemotaxis protein
MAIQLALAPRAHEERDRGREIDAHFEVATFSVLAALTAAALTTATMAWAGAMAPRTAPAWLAAMVALGAIHIAASQLYRRRRDWRRPWRRWALFSAAITLAEGLGWGLAPFAVPTPGNQAAQFLTMLTTLCVAAGSVIGAGRYLPTRVVAFVAPVAPYLVYSAFAGDRIERGSFFLLLLFLVAIGHLGLEADRGFRREAAMRRRNARLAEELQRQKEAAEQANVAKSKFLASASHDLRQPIHALGLYVGAMRQTALTPQLGALVAKMEISIAAVDRLFAAILDISRLDAGVVETHVETFALQALVVAVCEDFREDAGQKGLALVLERSDLFVRADPFLFERILRNLVSNAVRYTDAGAVRVRCRRRGDRVWLQVWDSGRGVARAQLSQIFEEYVQLGNPERDREKGLGLGLAIVRRLTALIGADLRVYSRLGRGSCFAVALPWSEPPPAGARTESVDAAFEPAQALVVVIDDEASVRDAMRTALAGWGLDVIDAAGAEGALAQLAATAVAPALLLCDYRLPAGEDGLDVIAQFRTRWPGLPAILVTGDTAPERLAQAHAQGVEILHKPVVFGRLRAAVGALAPRRRLSTPAPGSA